MVQGDFMGRAGGAGLQRLLVLKEQRYIVQAQIAAERRGRGRWQHHALVQASARRRVRVALQVLR